MSGPFESIAEVERRDSQFTTGYKEAIWDLRNFIRQDRRLTDAQSIVFMSMLDDFETDVEYERMYKLLGLKDRDLIMDYRGIWYKVLEPWCMVRRSIKAERMDGVVEYVNNNRVARHLSR